MKRTALYATVGSALALALLAYSLPASADVEVYASIQKTKDITVTETINITKTVDLTVTVDVIYNAAAEADAIVNQENAENRVDSSLGQLVPNLSDVNNYGIDLDAEITDSIINNTGIVDVNQDVGNMANQGNQVALAVALPGSDTLEADTPVVVNSQSEAEQINRDNAVWHGEDNGAAGSAQWLLNNPDGNNENAVIDGSINGNVGIVNVNQNAGNMNNQANSEALAVAINLAGVALSEAALGQVNINPDNTGIINVNQNAGNMNNQSNGVSAAVGIGALVALSDADLGQLNSGNHVDEFETVKVGSINGSVNGNTGIVNVNQSTGNMNNQGNVVSIAATVSGAVLGNATAGGL
jgi:hypothetical protein